MDAQKPQEKPDTAEAEAPPEPDGKVSADDEESKEVDQFDIEEDLDRGGDPYNSTGSHVILELKKVSGDE